MPYELLKIRLDALELDVMKVREVVKDTRRRTEDIRKIRKRLESEARGREALRQIRSLARRVGGVLQEDQEIYDLLDSRDEGLAQALCSQFASYADRLKVLLDELKQDLDELEHDMVDLPDEQLLESSLESLCRSVSGKISGLRTRANRPAGIPGAFDDLWRDYHEMLEDKARPLFAEYVDFVGGLAVRENALEDRVCQMTDVLLRELPHVTANALAVPARQAALSTIMKSVIKVGFPEWTVWGIPLVGHEVGLSIAENDPGIKSHVEQQGFKMSEALQKSLFADIFATYTLGPAYACAAILLRLEPHHATVEGSDPSDIDRGWLIFDVLDHLDRPGPWNDYTGQVSSYSDTVGKLRELWVGPAGSLTPRRGGSAHGAAKHAGIDGFLAETLKILSESRQFHPFNRDAQGVTEKRDRWVEAEKLVGYLLAPQEEGTSMPEFRRQDVIELLTATWRARLEHQEHHEHTTHIAENALRLWRLAPEDKLPSRSPGGLKRPSDGGREAARR